MRTEQLYYLLDLLKTSSLSKTAENYYTSHQVVNNAIKSLEKEFGVTILNRTYKGISFTEAGMLLCSYAEETLQNREKLLEKLAPFTTRISEPALTGKVDIYIISRFSNKHFLSFYNDYSCQHPNLSTNLKNISINTIFSLLPNQKNPFVILTTASERTLFSENFTNLLSQYNLAYAVFYASLLGFCISDKSIYFEQIASASTATPPENVPFLVFNYALDENSTLNDNFFLIDNFESQKKMIKSGKYVGICTPLEYEQFFKTNHATPLFIPDQTLLSPQFYYLALHPKITTANPCIQDFLSALKKYYNNP